MTDESREILPECKLEFQRLTHSWESIREQVDEIRENTSHIHNVLCGDEHDRPGLGEVVRNIRQTQEHQQERVEQVEKQLGNRVDQIETAIQNWGLKTWQKIGAIVVVIGALFSVVSQIWQIANGV